jgi:hypothetical protein
MTATPGPDHLVPINVGLEQMDLLGRYVEIQKTTLINKDMPSEREERLHISGRLVATFDKFVNDEIVETSLTLEGGGGMHNDRIFVFEWDRPAVDPDKQLIRPIYAKEQ